MNRQGLCMGACEVLNWVLKISATFSNLTNVMPYYLSRYIYFIVSDAPGFFPLDFAGWNTINFFQGIQIPAIRMHP